MWRGLFGSVAIHLLIFAFFVLPSPREAPAPAPPEKIEIAIHEAAAKPGRTRAGKRGRGGRRSKGPRGSPRWKDLKVKGDFGLASHEASPPGFDQDGDTSGWSPEQWGYGGGGMGQIHNTLNFDKLMVEVENMLNYPYALGSRGISGTINARLVFHQTKCAWNKTRIEGVQPYLKIYVLALLKKLCGLSTIQQLAFPEGQVIDLSFAFIITDNDEHAFQQTRLGRVTGNVLMFDRTFPAGNADYQLGPIRGLWFAPVWYLDWPWVVEHWEEWVEGKDPLGDFRQSN